MFTGIKREGLLQLKNSFARVAGAALMVLGFGNVATAAPGDILVATGSAISQPTVITNIQGSLSFEGDPTKFSITATPPPGFFDYGHADGVGTLVRTGNNLSYTENSTAFFSGTSTYTSLEDFRVSSDSSYRTLAAYSLGSFQAFSQVSSLDGSSQFLGASASLASASHVLTPDGAGNFYSQFQQEYNTFSIVMQPYSSFSAVWNILADVDAACGTMCFGVAGGRFQLYQDETGVFEDILVQTASDFGYNTSSQLGRKLFENNTDHEVSVYAGFLAVADSYIDPGATSYANYNVRGSYGQLSAPVSAPVPEPGTCATMLAGALVVGATVARRRRKHNDEATPSSNFPAFGFAPSNQL